MPTNDGPHFNIGSWEIDTPYSHSPVHMSQNITPSAQVYQENANDYHVKYSNCFGVLNNNVVMALDFYNNEDDEGSNSPTMDYKILESSVWSSENGDMDIIESINWTLPHLGAINVLDTVLFTIRKHKQNSPTRYRKALRFDILDIYDPTRKELNMLGRASYSHNDEAQNDILESIFFPKKFEIEEALDSTLSLDRLGTALSSDYYLTLSNSVNNILLWRGFNIIGVWNKGNKRFNIHTSLFTNDLDNLGIKWEAA